MDADPAPGSALEAVARNRALPWVRVMRGLRIAFDGRKLILASLALLALSAAGALLDRLAPTAPAPLAMSSWTSGLSLPGESSDSFSALGGLARALAQPWTLLWQPYQSLLRPGQTPAGLGMAVLRLVVVVVIATLTGGAISRIAALDLAGTDRIGVVGALRFALGRAPALITAPLSPLLALAIFGGLSALIGLGYRIPGTVGATVAGALGFVPLLCGLVMALIVIGLAAGWPLMTVTVAAEGEDAFDAISRSYSYVYQRPLRYGLSVLLAWALGVAGLIFAMVFARLVAQLAVWGQAFGGGQAVLDAWNLAGSAHEAAPLAAFWLGVVRLLTASWVLSYFWSAATAIYLDLRQDIDGAQPDDVYRAAHDADTFAGDPPPARPGAATTTEPAAPAS